MQRTYAGAKRTGPGRPQFARPATLPRNAAVCSWNFSVFRRTLNENATAGTADPIGSRSVTSVWKKRL